MKTHLFVVALAILALSGCIVSPDGENAIFCKNPYNYQSIPLSTKTYHVLDRISSVSPRTTRRGAMKISVKTCTTFNAQLKNETWHLPKMEERVSVVSEDGESKVLNRIDIKPSIDGIFRTNTSFNFPPEIPSGLYIIRTQLLTDNIILRMEETSVLVE